MIVVTIGYVLLSGALTLVVPYYKINPTAALSEAFADQGLVWAKYVIRYETSKIKKQYCLVL